MSSFAVNDCSDATRHPGYQSFAVLLGDYSDLNFLHCLPQFSALDGWLHATLSFIIVHRFSIESRSGWFPGYSNRKIWGFSSGTQWLPLIGDKESHLAWWSWSRGRACAVSTTLWIIWLGVCFIVTITYFLSIHLPNGRLMCMWRGTNWSMVHLSENNTFFHSAKFQWRWRLAKSSLFFFITRAGLWNFSPNSLLRRLETVLKLIAVPFKRKIALMSHWAVFPGRSLP